MTILGYKDIIDHSLTFLNDDFTELWVIAVKIQDLNPEFRPFEVLDATKIIAADLIINHNATLVDIESQTTVVKPTSETIEILNKHLDQFDTVPNIGDGLWLTIENKSA